MRPTEEQQANQRASLVQLARTLPTSIHFGWLLAAIAVLYFSRFQSPRLILAWFALHLLLGLWRQRVVRALQRQLDAGEYPARPMTMVRAGCLAAGLAWGSLALFPLGASEPELVLFSAFLLAGVTSGGATAMASDLVSAWLFQFSVLSLLALRLLVLEGDGAFQVMGFTTLLYIAFMAAWTRRLNAAAIAGIRAQLDAQQRERQIAMREARYRDLAHHDALTGLPNRLSLQSELPRLLELAWSRHKPVALMFLDLDHFKDINDSRGHRCGDHVLAITAGRLRECVRPGDMVARMGGDEFIVAGLDAQSVEQVQSLARRLAERIAQPIEFENTMVHITASMGIAVFPDHGAGLDELLRHADMALYAAKAGGRQNHALFVPSMGAAFSERIFLQHALARALGTDELSLVYQPLINLQTGALTGFEALLRWRHPERGMVPPLVFIPVAEKCGLIDALGDEVVQRVCRQLGRWQFAGLPLLPVAINVSALHFERGNLGPQMVAAARAAHIDPALLQLEITESALMNSSAQGARNLAELKAAGIKVTIDDFGIGYSSLNQLKSFAIDGLKIDRSFVRDMTTDTRDASIVSAIIGIARSLGISVLAEGVESMQHVQQLRALGCEHGQGNYLFEPASVENCATLLARHARGEAVFRQLLRLQAVSV